MDEEKNWIILNDRKIEKFILFILLNFASHLANEDNFNSKLIFLKFIFRFRIRIYQSKKTDPNPDPQKKQGFPIPTEVFYLLIRVQSGRFVVIIHTVHTRR